MHTVQFIDICCANNYDDILRCQSVKHNCEIYHNRDKNAVQNMLKIVKSIFNTGKRPLHFCRNVKLDDEIFHHRPEVFCRSG